MSSRKVDVDAFEADLHARLSDSLHARQLDVERARLERVGVAAERLRARIRVQVERVGNVGSGQVRRLQERLEEILQEEASILQRIGEMEGGDGVGDGVGDDVVSQHNDHIQVKESESDQEMVDEPEPKTIKYSESESADSDDSAECETATVEPECVDDMLDSVYSARTSSLPPLPSIETITMYNNFKVPRSLHDRLFSYQQEGLQWLLKLYAQRAGGILGDEMGLGKTVQVIAAIASLHVSGMLATAPALIVCPTTLIRQWLSEAQQWWPHGRVLVIHSQLQPVAAGSISRIKFEKFQMVITSYGHLQQHRQLLVDGVRWRAVFLDEGHKIRNPATQTAILCKQLKTTHRYILSGTPIQNNLIELWSLFDFVFPGKLGTVSVFKEEFSMPIHAGGYLNANSAQVRRAYASACALRDLIEPFLLRRLKVDVAKQLPSKREQIIFCPLTEYQRRLYLAFLESEPVHSILLGKRNVLYGIDILRKISNHPDLLAEAEWNEHILAEGAGLSLVERSGKLAQLVSVLTEWRRQGHRALLFCQTRQMLDLVESFIRLTFHGEFDMLRMDGTTPVTARSGLVDRFNADPRHFLFLLTTRVGGLGVNLIGADRVLIVDPDWNPSTDQQARERSWRLGQHKPVLIYRLIAEGTVEEKILQRQVFKTFLTQRVLKDPKQSRFFKHSDLHDLFTYGTTASVTEPEQDQDQESASGDRLIRDIADVTGIRDSVERAREQHESQYEREKTRMIVADSVASLQHSGDTLRLSMNIPSAHVDPAELDAAIRNIASEADPAVVRLARHIIQYLSDGGAATSQAIFERFRPDSHRDAAVLKQTLKAVAVLDRTRHTWTLKPRLD
jgi:DNA excision repair protein ERCC-6